MWGKKGLGRGHRAAAFTWLIAMAGVSGPALAGSFSVNPVQLSLPDDRQAASLTLKNSDAAPVSVRIEALEWTQVDGVDHYGPTTNVIVSPPIFTAQAGQSQLVRIGLKDRSPARSYRIILEEIPRQKPPAGKIDVLLRLNLPLYVLPKGGGKTDVHWRAWRNPDGSFTVEGRNQGSLHLQVTEIDAAQGGSTIALSKQMGAVLPGSARNWKVPASAKLQPGAPLNLTIKSPAGDSQTRIILEPR